MRPSPQIGVIHTSPATVELFGRLIRARVPDAHVINLLDDSILPELRDNGGDLALVEPRWRDYVRIVRDRRVDIILNACSSVGELCARVQPGVPQAIVRVDAGMAREAVRRGTQIAVIATLATTLRPTIAIITETAAAQGKSVSLEGILVEGAYSALISGDQARHDDLVASALAKAVSSDVVVLAQASMARVLSRLPEQAQAKVLASPGFAVDDVVSGLAAIGRA